MKQTAVEWLINKLDGENHLSINEINRVVEQAKEMEKEQIKDAWNTRSKIDGVITFTDNRTAKQYYNETFKSE